MPKKNITVFFYFSFGKSSTMLRFTFHSSKAEQYKKLFKFDLNTIVVHSNITIQMITNHLKNFLTRFFCLIVRESYTGI
jgi:hypothetical protein